MGDGVDELDIALLDALHLNPLASFEELGTVLDVSPVTAARRWRRLVATGRAWVSSAPGRELPLKAALFEAECQPGAASAVADEFAAIPQVFSVNITTGQDNLYAFCGCRRSTVAGEVNRRQAADHRWAEPGAIGADDPVVQRHPLAAGRSQS
ncbi:MAG TPA: AsnC family transcriptional regulator [Mycobacterium sp.]|uniref:Lrp/AsnC family transcriptional regulator n=1 Tax=Mycobacterium sp. TaxID=1785 RepID=UPI002C3B6498|nr:AsnC family transcriptional regulator [Mycobacterium sp.]HME76892.1 AsnC family transcriptional regulator [Mycobacterium sp.]